ncbi:uncharacterized protein LOC131426438 [Malaya genurostris]|uniref:uncharacterized protein LOC131426438 n=1 Tax=Malaya genurostris TaxID=325434 RepID=UPI0026F3FEBF|nr:uncharacterized protein LOC131426438 [Malaya genurostris]
MPFRSSNRSAALRSENLSAALQQRWTRKREEQFAKKDFSKRTKSDIDNVRRSSSDEIDIKPMLSLDFESSTTPRTSPIAPSARIVNMEKPVQPKPIKPQYSAPVSQSFQTKKRKRISMTDRILVITKQTERGTKCDAVDNCNYTQAPGLFRPGNFFRHVRANHPEVYNKLLMDDELTDGRPEFYTRKTTTRRTPNNIGESVVVRFSKHRFLCGLIKLITNHNLPFEYVTWEGIQDLIGLQCDAFKMTISPDTLQDYVGLISERMQTAISEELCGRFVALQLNVKIEQNGQSAVCVKCQYIRNCQFFTRMLGMIHLSQGSSMSDLDANVEKIKSKYGLDPWQIYTVAVDYDPIDFGGVEIGVAESIQLDEVQDNSTHDIFDQYVSSLKDFSVLPCGRHMLSLVATNATKDFVDTINELVDMVKRFQNPEYEIFFQLNEVNYPPVPAKKHYGFGVYFMMKSMKESRPSMEQLTADHPELALYMHWDFIEEFVSAYEPIYDCAVRTTNCSLSEFHLQWLLAFGRIRCLRVNRFGKALLEAMECQQKELEKAAPYRAALYLDPRLNFRGSKLFTVTEKEKIIAFLMSIYNMSENTPADTKTTPTPSVAGSSSESTFSMNAYLTEMLGEGSSDSSMEQVIREIQHQERWDADDQEFDIIKYWLQKKMHDARLWPLAVAVFAPPASHCTSEEDFSHVGGSFDTTDASLSDEILCVKYNSGLMERAVREEFCEGKHCQSESDHE